MKLVYIENLGNGLKGWDLIDTENDICMILTWLFNVNISG